MADRNAVHVDLLSPRLGVTMNPTSDGRPMRARARTIQAGRTHGEPSSFIPGEIDDPHFVPATGGYTEIASVVDPGINLRLDSGMRAPTTNEYSVGVDRQLTRRVSAAIAYIHKDGNDFIGWTDVGGQYGEESRTLPDGSSVPVFVLLNGTGERRFLLTNPDGYSLTYNGLVMTIDKRRSGGWQGVRLIYAVEQHKDAAFEWSKPPLHHSSAPLPPHLPNRSHSVATRTI